MWMLRVSNYYDTKLTAVKKDKILSLCNGALVLVQLNSSFFKGLNHDIRRLGHKRVQQWP
jgi:hypothetical protein